MGSEGKALKMDRPAAGGFLSLTALRAEGCGIALTGDEYYNAAFRRSRPHRVSYSFLPSYIPSPLRGPLPLKGTQERYRICLSSSYVMKSITVISHLRWLPPPLVPYGTTFPPRYRSGDKSKAPLWAGEAPYFARLAHPMQDVHSGQYSYAKQALHSTHSEE